MPGTTVTRGTYPLTAHGRPVACPCCLTPWTVRGDRHGPTCECVYRFLYWETFCRECERCSKHCACQRPEHPALPLSVREEPAGGEEPQAEGGTI